MEQQQPAQRVPAAQEQEQGGHRKDHHAGHHPGTGPLLPAQTDQRLRPALKGPKGLYLPLHPDAPPAYENLSQEELEKLMQRYDEYRGVPSRKEERLSENGTVSEKRTPIRPRESMKDILYNGVGVGEESYQKGSRVGFGLCSSRGPTATITTITAGIENELHIHHFERLVHELV